MSMSKPVWQAKYELWTDFKQKEPRLFGDIVPV